MNSGGKELTLQEELEIMGYGSIEDLVGEKTTELEKRIKNCFPDKGEQTRIGLMDVIDEVLERRGFKGLTWPTQANIQAGLIEWRPGSQNGEGKEQLPAPSWQRGGGMEMGRGSLLPGEDSAKEDKSMGANGVIKPGTEDKSVGVQAPEEVRLEDVFSKTIMAKLRASDNFAKMKTLRELSEFVQVQGEIGRELLAECFGEHSYRAMGSISDAFEEHGLPRIPRKHRRGVKKAAAVLTKKEPALGEPAKEPAQDTDAMLRKIISEMAELKSEMAELKKGIAGINTLALETAGSLVRLRGTVQENVAFERFVERCQKKSGINRKQALQLLEKIPDFFLMMRLAQGIEQDKDEEGVE